MADITAEGAWASDSELMIGLVAPIGVDLTTIIQRLEHELQSVAYESKTVHLTQILRDLKDLPDPTGADDAKYLELMKLGNEFRTGLGRNDAMALLAVTGIIHARTEFKDSGATRRAYILRQMKRPEEVDMLRRLYGENFVVVAAIQPRSERIERLAQSIATSEERGAPTDADRTRADELIRRDEREEVEGGRTSATPSRQLTCSSIRPT